MSHTHCYEWFKRFKDGWQTTHDEPHLGQPSTSCDDAHVVQVREIMHSNQHFTLREIAEDCNISIESDHEILTTKLEMHRLVSKFVPRLLTLDQRDSRIALYQELLDRTSEDENFLKRIITSNETWFMDTTWKRKCSPHNELGKIC
jgi:predicted DNA-binding protein YlxM (UPF0122 family)